MSAIAQGEDLTKNSVSVKRSTSGFRPTPGGAFPIGTLVKLRAIDNQIFPDYKTIEPSAAAQRDKKIVGVVSEEWSGFDTAGGTTAGNANARGTQSVSVTCRGFHSAVLIDNTDATAAAITDGVALSSSKAAVGKCQGDNAPVVGTMLGWAALPAAGLGSSLGAGAVTQASQTATIAGVPTAGDTLSVTVQVPGIMAAPGVAQTRTISVVLTAAQAASANTAAAALQAALAADPVFAVYYSATVLNAVVTVSANAAALFSVYHATPYTNTGLPIDPGGFRVNLSGTVGNSLTFACAAVGGSTNTAGGATLANGAGYKGICPAWITCGGA
jgi:hypothetical protein